MAQIGPCRIVQRASERFGLGILHPNAFRPGDSAEMTKFDRVLLIASTVALSGTLLCGGVNAQTVTMDQYQHPKSEKDLSFNKAYLEGVKDGLIAYNMSLEDKLFCLGGMPPVLTFERASDTVLHWARKKEMDRGGSPLGLSLLYSLEEAFPCKGAPR